MDKDIENWGAVPSEPVFSIGDKQDRLASLYLDLNDDLQDEIGERRAQFTAAMNAIEDEREKRTHDKGLLIVGIILAALPGWMYVFIMVLIGLGCIQ